MFKWRLFQTVKLLLPPICPCLTYQAPLQRAQKLPNSLAQLSWFPRVLSRNPQEVYAPVHFQDLPAEIVSVDDNVYTVRLRLVSVRASSSPCRHCSHTPCWHCSPNRQSLSSSSISSVVKLTLWCKVSSLDLSLGTSLLHFLPSL